MSDFKVLAWLPFPSDVLPAPLLKAWCVTAKALPDISAISALTAVKHGSYSSLTPPLQPGTHQKIIDMATNGVGCRAAARIMGVGLNTVLRHSKTQAAVGNLAQHTTGRWCWLSALKWTNSGGYVGAKSRQRWLFYAYDGLGRQVVAHVFGERTMATLGRL